MAVTLPFLYGKEKVELFRSSADNTGRIDCERFNDCSSVAYFANSKTFFVNPKTFFSNPNVFESCGQLPNCDPEEELYLGH